MMGQNPKLVLGWIQLCNYHFIVFSKFWLNIHIKSLSFQQTVGCLDLSCAFLNMCYRSLSRQHFFVINNSSMHAQLGILIVQYFSNLVLEQILVKELKSSRVDRRVSALVKPVTWWYRPVGHSRTTVAVAVWKVSLRWCTEVFTDKDLATQIWLDGQILCLTNIWCFTGDWIWILNWNQWILIMFWCYFLLLTDDGAIPRN